MSKKDDRIEELENYKTASTLLIRSIGEALNVHIPRITVEILPMLINRMSAAINGIRGPGGSDPGGSDPDDRAAWSEASSRFADMDEMIDRANAKLDPDAVARAGRAIGGDVNNWTAFGAGNNGPQDAAARNDAWHGITQEHYEAARARHVDATQAVPIIVPTRQDFTDSFPNPPLASNAPFVHAALTVPRESDTDQAETTLRQVFGEIQEPLEAIADELGINIHESSLPTALNEIRDEINRIKNPSGDVAADAAGALSKGDSLSEAIAHNRAAQRNLELELDKARGIIQRVAGAMQIGQWDADGTELVERAQRWDGFKHALRKSLDVWRARASSFASNDGDPTGAIVLELSGFLALLTSHKDLAAWLKNKPKVAASEITLSLASERVTGQLFSTENLGDIVICLQQTDVDRAGSLWTRDKMTAIECSRVARDEFINLMNLVILPILARQGA